MPAAAGAPARPLIGVGRVRHARLRPVRHAFDYPTWFVMLPLRAMRGRSVPGLARNRRAIVSFHDRDHGLGGDDALAWFEGLLAESGIDGVDGEIWLHTYPRVCGFAFKPVSFWYAHAADGTLRAVLAEVNNTFGERHAYLLHGSALRWGAEVCADKVFHVSPFCAVRGVYRFRFLRTAAGSPNGERTVVRIDHDDVDGPLLQTSVSGELQPLTPASLWRVVAAMPLLGFGVVARIHLQALRLWFKRVPFRRKPDPPPAWVTR
jgi:DUF1365 family protein